VICPGGWWEQPKTVDGKTPWAFHPANLGAACADMFAADLDGNGTPGVLSTSAHQFGMWWHRQKPNPKGGNSTFEQVPLFGRLVSETHAAHYVDIDGDGLKDLVTGKRYWSHGRSEPGHGWNANVYWLKAIKEKDGAINFTPMLIDDDCGVGTQFEVSDINGDGLLDVIVSNKKGVRIVIQQRMK
jgi:FG-GAP-like repeat